MREGKEDGGRRHGGLNVKEGDLLFHLFTKVFDKTISYIAFLRYSYGMVVY